MLSFNEYSKNHKFWRGVVVAAPYNGVRYYKWKAR